MFFSSEVHSYESKTMSIIFLKFAREMFANFVQSSGGVQVAVLSSLRGQQTAALHVLPTFEFGDIQRREYIFIVCLRCCCLRIFALSDLLND